VVANGCYVRAHSASVIGQINLHTAVIESPRLVASPELVLDRSWRLAFDPAALLRLPYARNLYGVFIVDVVMKGALFSAVSVLFAYDGGTYRSAVDLVHLVLLFHPVAQTIPYLSISHGVNFVLQCGERNNSFLDETLC
jgi:hypothetical protein